MGLKEKVTRFAGLAGWPACVIVFLSFCRLFHKKIRQGIVGKTMTSVVLEQDKIAHYE